MMESLLYIFAWTIAVLTVFALVLGSILWSRRKKKSGPVAPSGGIAVPPPLKEKWYKNPLWVILIIVGVVIVVALFWWILGMVSAWEAPKPSRVWKWTKDYWLWAILFLAGSFFVFNYIDKPLVKGLRGMVVVVAVVWAGALLVHVIWGEKSPLQQAQSCPKYGSGEWRDCLVTENGVILTSDDQADYAEFELCYIKLEKTLLQGEWLGPKAIRVKSQRGTVQFQYKMVRQATLVNGCPKKT